MKRAHTMSAVSLALVVAATAGAASLKRGESAPGTPASPVTTGSEQAHCWTGYSPERAGEDLSTVEFLRIAADHLRANQPAGTAHTAWYR